MLYTMCKAPSWRQSGACCLEATPNHASGDLARNCLHKASVTTTIATAQYGQEPVNVDIASDEVLDTWGQGAPHSTR